MNTNIQELDNIQKLNKEEVQTMSVGIMIRYAILAVNDTFKKNPDKLNAKNLAETIFTSASKYNDLWNKQKYVEGNNRKQILTETKEGGYLYHNEYDNIKDQVNNIDPTIITNLLANLDGAGSALAQKNDIKPFKKESIANLIRNIKKICEEKQEEEEKGLGSFSSVKGGAEFNRKMEEIVARSAVLQVAELSKNLDTLNADNVANAILNSIKQDLAVFKKEKRIENKNGETILKLGGEVNGIKNSHTLYNTAYNNIKKQTDDIKPKTITNAFANFDDIRNKLNNQNSINQVFIKRVIGNIETIYNEKVQEEKKLEKETGPNVMKISTENEFKSLAYSTIANYAILEATSKIQPNANQKDVEQAILTSINNYVTSFERDNVLKNKEGEVILQRTVGVEEITYQLYNDRYGEILNEVSEIKEVANISIVSNAINSINKGENAKSNAIQQILSKAQETCTAREKEKNRKNNSKQNPEEQQEERQRIDLGIAQQNKKNNKNKTDNKILEDSENKTNNIQYNKENKQEEQESIIVNDTSFSSYLHQTLARLAILKTIETLKKEGIETLKNEGFNKNNVTDAILESIKENQKVFATEKKIKNKDGDTILEKVTEKATNASGQPIYKFYNESYSNLQEQIDDIEVKDISSLNNIISVISKAIIEANPDKPIIAKIMNSMVDVLEKKNKQEADKNNQQRQRMIEEKVLKKLEKFGQLKKEENNVEKALSNIQNAKNQLSQAIKDHDGVSVNSAKKSLSSAVESLQKLSVENMQNINEKFVKMDETAKAQQNVNSDNSIINFFRTVLKPINSIINFFRTVLNPIVSFFAQFVTSNDVKNDAKGSKEGEIMKSALSKNISLEDFKGINDPNFANKYANACDAMRNDMQNNIDKKPEGKLGNLSEATMKKDDVNNDKPKGNLNILLLEGQQEMTFNPAINQGTPKFNQQNLSLLEYQPNQSNQPKKLNQKPEPTTTHRDSIESKNTQQNQPSRQK